MVTDDLTFPSSMVGMTGPLGLWRLRISKAASDILTSSQPPLTFIVTLVLENIVEVPASTIDSTIVTTKMTAFIPRGNYQNETTLRNCNLPTACRCSALLGFARYIDTAYRNLMKTNRQLTAGARCFVWVEISLSSCQCID